MYVVNNLRKCREEKGVTQSEVGAAVHVDKNSISRYENGRLCPKLEIALELSDYFGKSVNEIFHLQE